MIQVRLADEKRPSVDQARDDGRGALGDIRECWASGRRRQSLDVDIVFDGERDAVKR